LKIAQQTMLQHWCAHLRSASPRVRLVTQPK
jgi:hypothetical protein